MTVPAITDGPLWAAALEPEPTAPNYFSVLSDEYDGCVTLHVYGDVDLATGPLLEECVAAAEADAPPRLVLNLRGVTFMDSTGLGLILRSLRRAQAQGRELALAGVPSQPRRLLAVTGVDRLLELEA